MISQKQILIVEDNELNRAMLCEILSDEYQVLEAENGQAALDVLKQYKDSVALILLDVMMPVMDGYAFLDLVKADAELALIPVIVMTQSGSEADEVAALAHGATDFVPKPYRPRVILHRIASIIKLRETAAMVNLLQYDRLTGLYTREFFYQKVRERLQKEPEKEYTIICTNIENFKLYNDNFGIPAGDALLKKMAHWLLQSSGPHAICGRFNADRFLCLQEREQERKDRSVIAENDTPLIKNVIMKWGIYDIVDRSVSVEQMCDRALLAVDSIRGQYNRHFALYDDALRAKMLREKAITDTMEAALAEGQFTVFFQPKYSLKEECMAGAEALVRWIHPKWGFMSPGEFIPLFEKNGFIPNLDRYIWERVCEKLREWKEKGYPLLPVSVNVSRADVYQIDLVETLGRLVRKYEIDPSCLHLEITESAYAENPGEIISTVNQLRKLGFIIEMDDFGSGYSSLNMLNQMKMDILKLDMKFVQNEMAKSADQSILNYIIGMSHGMGLSVVAEGVETREQLDRLRDIACDYVQGYYFAKPMPAEEYEELLKRQFHRNRGSVGKPETLKERKNERVLLMVEEDESYRALVRSTFEEKYRVLEACDVEHALSFLEEGEENAVIAVLLSLTLPEDGAAAFLKVLRQNPVFWHVPVLATIPEAHSLKELPLALETEDFVCKCHPQRDLLRRVERLMELSESYEREIVLKDEANRDFLTGLFNRRGLQAAVDSIRKEDLPLALCLFDLDDLKRINDLQGHDEGDRLIQSFADLLKQQTREQDILCRYGGDEFLIILKRMNSREAAVKRATDICSLFQTSCSAGIVFCTEVKDKFSYLLQCADQALYHAKREKKGACCLWERDKIIELQ
ncbi:MAG: EAL domain-containing protein [Blautia sp.]|nr:EAL domain-containing protein [Blautia sp.]MDY5032405.1 EAL domain-containing protein [Blautia sp.]